uniref:caspase b-like n=1 Tax=Gasterosteus aculeatus aculeatus TaxID=481459 RepID=UPI001A99C375|nr:caspase b-like [Gasterosteus aculeatus aculeatus]
MSVKKLLLEVLENLVQDDFKRFKLHLTEVGVEGFEPIYKSRLENADRTDTVGTIVKSYGEQVAVKITVEVLKLIGNCDAAEKLRNEYKGADMSVKMLLLDVLENLVQDDFKSFKWHLTDVVLEGFEPISKSRLENADRIDTVTRILERYDEQRAVKITVDVLKLIGNYYAAEKLDNKYKAGGGEASSSASAAAPPP